jgi:hypothetical protein
MGTALGVDGSISSRSRSLRWLGWRLNRCCGYIGVIVAGYGWLDDDSSSSTWGLTVGVLLGTVVMVGAILAPDPPILEMVMLAATPLTF